MNIGEKVKELRCAKMMTQKELAGELITRNMLSRIENGSALPSLQTLLYLASRLGVPAGYLLAEEKEEFGYRKDSKLPDIKRAFESGDWLICRDLCEKFDERDDEISFLLCRCMYNAAVDEFGRGNLRTSLEYFEEAKRVASDTIYPTDTLRAQSDVYISCMERISPSLTSDNTPSEWFSLSSLADPFCRYFVLLYSLETDAESILDKDVYMTLARREEKNLAEHLLARQVMAKKHFSEAYSILKRLLSNNADLPAPVLYFLFSDLEVCCRELSDYRGAYEYSSDKTAMLERFLR